MQPPIEPTELIAAESRLYERAGILPDHRAAMRVARRDEQAQDIMSLTLVPDAGGKPADFHPGQYVSVVVELEPGVFQQRQYSLSDAPNGRDWRITVRRDTGVNGNPYGTVSNWLHDNIRVGATLRVSQPFGDFMPALDGEGSIVLMSAGVGITPMISVLNALAGQVPARKVVFAHAARNQSYVAHLDDIEAAKKRLPNLTAHYYLEAGMLDDLNGIGPRAGRMNAGSLIAEDPPLVEATFYMCGPLPFMQAQRAALLQHGVPVERIHREVFGPDLLDHLL